MLEVIFNKLVRDKVPEIILKDGKIPKFKYLTNDEYFICLKDKLLEECKEVLSSKNVLQMMGELADVLEVIKSLVENSNCGMEQLEKIRKEKFDIRGGFNLKIFLEKVVIDD